MLTATFQHIPGVGEKKERELWSRGCVSWDHLLAKDYGLPGRKYARIKEHVLESKERLCALDHDFFRCGLGSKLSWRAYNIFREHACFLDIETTGLSAHSSHVTTVCVHGNKGTKSYIADDNMEELARDLSEYRFIVSFNGARFDLPFLSSSLGLEFPQIHLDLLYPLKSLGYSGGLKNIEKNLGMSRDTDGVTGYDAVRLWHAYKRDRSVEVAGRRVKGKDALDLLIEYNREDTVNLEKLADYTVSELKKKTNPALNPPRE
jgi:uncharacterized protein YprB with RNaseH-like and TPR domain